MLGWEFPPFITGGLGTACYGLTKAMDRAGMDITFVLPKSVPPTETSHVQLMSPGTAMAAPIRTFPKPTRHQRFADVINSSGQFKSNVLIKELRERFRRTEFVDLPFTVESNYGTHDGVHRTALESIAEKRLLTLIDAGAFDNVSDPEVQREIAELIGDEPEELPVDGKPPTTVDYGGDLIGQANAYARFCVDVARRVEFDVIHAHDWLTYPAGMAVARLSGRPLVVQVHSTEFDRSGEHVNQPVYNIERRGMQSAIRVITVSELTKRVCVSRYGVNPDKIDVVYNGVDFEPTNIKPIETKDKIVLFFGRITMQKGPEYFVQAAKRVLEVMDNVKFVVAGSGDLAAMMIEMAAEMGIGHKVLFTGFLRGRDISRVFALADLYVMPSVSEPFGIAPLEAMSHDVPVLISKSSGVSEVLSHALKVDFWDVDEIANKIVAVLRHAPLRKALRDNGRFEIRSLTWDGAAKRCGDVYEKMIEEFAVLQ